MLTEKFLELLGGVLLAWGVAHLCGGTNSAAPSPSSTTAAAPSTFTTVGY